MTISRTAGGPLAPTVGADHAPSPAAPVTPSAPSPTHPSEDGLLDQLKRKLRPGPSSVAAGPFYLRTSIAPLRMPATPGPAVELSTGTEFRPATAQWIQERSAALVDRLHPAAQASTGAAGALGAAGAAAATDATDGTVAPGSIVGTPGSTPDATHAAVRVVASATDFASATAALFTRGSQETTESPALQRLIDTLLPGAQTPATLTAAGSFGPSLQVARALSTATRGDADAALAALERLRRMPMVPSLVRGLGPAPAHGTEASTAGAPGVEGVEGPAGAEGAPDGVHHCAWRAALLLGATRSGLEGLIRLSADASMRAPGEAGEMKRESLRTFLQAAAHIESTGTAAAGDPTRRTHATDALLCAAKLYADPMATAAQIDDPAQVSAYVAWRSGYRDRGPGTPLARTQARMAKFTTWIRRAERRATQPRAAFDPRRLVGMKKSPLNATAFAAGGTNLGLASTEAQRLQQTLGEALGAASARLGALSTWRVLPSARRAELLLRQQCLARWRHVTGQAGAAVEWKPSSQDRATIATAAAVLAPGLGLDPASVKHHPALAELKRLDLKTLARWLQEAPPVAAPGTGDAPGASAEALLARVRDLNAGRPIRPAGPARGDIQAALAEVIDTTPLGNNVRYFDGATYGLNANQSLNMQDFKAMIGLSVGPGFKALRGRHAFLEIGSSSYGGEVFMGIDQRSSKGLSLGVFGGIALGAGESTFHASLGGGVGYGYSHDTSGPSGVIIRTRVERDEANKPTDSWRGKANEVLAFLFAQSERAEGARGAAPEQLWQDFSEHFFRERDISVNWRDQRRGSHTVSKVANAMARLSLAGWNFGPSLSASRDHLLAGKNERIDANGWLRGVERSRAQSSALNVNAALVSASASPGHFARHPGQPESVSLPSVPLVGVSAALVPKGASVTLRMVDEHGDLHPGYIRRLVEFVDPASFNEYLGARANDIAKTPQSRQRLRDFVAEVNQAAVRGNQSFGESLKLRPEVVETINLHRDEIEMIRRCAAVSRGGQSPALEDGADAGGHAWGHAGGDAPVDARAARLEAEIARLLNEPASWKVSGYYTYEINTTGYTAGPAFIAQATASTATNGERVLAELAVSELEALDQQTLDQPPRDQQPRG
ncbi:hypothetical protein [Mitsuaria sp. BK037]|uniref:hypothetical protein n=1 Tax=Mitsuaria sp. BK037 TaxID=2587122 RepID=UPI00161B082C|nr:hypothetical protein [Mitsuaria sp. BK037]MBB3282177.1 hypothetical protein [Mitsuaria sp. BK037]